MIKHSFTHGTKKNSPFLVPENEPSIRILVNKNVQSFW